MGSKKKRKSTAPADDQPPKRPSSQQGRWSGGGGSSSSGGALSWSNEGVTVTLPSNQALVFVGQARLDVQSGEVHAFGSCVSAASGAVELTADERSGGALLLEPGAAQGTVPLASSGTAAVFTLTQRAHSSGSGGRSGGGNGRAAGSGGGAAPLPVGSGAQQQSQGEGGPACGEAARRQLLGFEVWLSGDPSAPATPPPLPPLWQQAVGEVEAMLLHHQQQQQQQATAGTQAAPVIVVCGAKKVGKSTFARFLANSLLCRHPCVAYLDTDCGQPEFTPPGLVSLTLLHAPVLGPPHLHQQRPAASFFVGDVSPANDPVRYLQCVRELYCWYCQHGVAAAAAAAAAAPAPAGAAAGGQPPPASAPQPPPAQQQQGQGQLPLPPLVVNTHGWVKGMGFDVLVELLQGLPVTHLVQIAAANPRKDLPPGTFWLPQPADSGSGDAAATSTPPQQQQLHPHQPPQVLQWVLPGLGGDQPAQPAASETSARSAATYGTTAPGGAEGGAGLVGGGGAGGGAAGGGKGRLHAVEQRALHWEALAQQCVQACGLAPAARLAPAGGGSARGGGKSAAAAAAATAAAGAAGGEDLGDRLAAAVPFVVDAADVEIQVLHSSVPTSQLFYALNGAVVGLCTRAQPPLPPPQPLSPLQQPAAQLPPCLGLGIIRAADAGRRQLHLLTDLPESELEAVQVVQLGRLELPASLLQTGAHMSPYLALHSLSSAGTGAGAIKSRNNLLRQSQL